jgi:hypothetical protein
VNRKVIGLPARRRLGKRPPQGIVDHLFHRCPRAVDGLVNELGDVGVQRRGSTHLDIIVPLIGGIKMRHRLARRSAVPGFPLVVPPACGRRNVTDKSIKSID